MLMTPQMAAIGGLLAFFSVVAFVVVLPTATYNPPPSNNWLPLSDQAVEGRALFLSNGCVYCHSGFSRPQDVFNQPFYLYPRISEPGDYHGESQSPNILGTERTGPDLSQEGGMHPDGWHLAHYENPRFTNPRSVMPQFSFWNDQEKSDMIAFNQTSGGKEAMLRYATVLVGNHLMRINGGMPVSMFPDLQTKIDETGGYNPQGQGSDMSPSGLPWMLVWHINSFERSYWLTQVPLPVTQQNLVRGKKLFLTMCVGCHGVNGDGKGPAADFLSPKPFDFTRSDLNMWPGASDGMMYHRILTAGPGTAMESFGTRLSVDDIWKVVMFLRTIPNGSLEQDVPEVSMYRSWVPAEPFLRYIEQNPIEEGITAQVQQDPFLAAANWLAPGMNLDTEVLVGGQIPMTLERLSTLIRMTYMEMVERAYQDALDRGEDLPPRTQIFSTEGVVWHQP